MISGSENGYVYMWDLVEGSLIHKLEHVEEIAGLGKSSGNLTIHSLTFHPEKCELLTAAKGKVYIWSDQEKSADEEME